MLQFEEDFLSKSHQFEDIRGELHSRPFLLCSPKSIIRHCSLWIEDSRYHKGQPSFAPSSPNVLWQNIEKEYNNEAKILNALYSSIESSYAKFIVSGEIPNSTNKKNVFNIIAGYDTNGFYNRILVSRQYNRVSLIHVVDFDHKSSTKDPSAPPLTNHPLNMATSAIDDSLREYNKVLDNEEVKGNDDYAARRYIDENFWRPKKVDGSSIIALNRYKILSDHLDELFDRHWESHERALIQAIENAITTAKVKYAAPEYLKISCFYDARGLIWPGFDKLRAQREGLNPDSSEYSDDKPDDKLILNANWPLVKASEYLDAHVSEGDDSKEIDVKQRLRSQKGIFAGSISSFNKDIKAATGIFVSTLGQVNGHRKLHTPIRYFVLAKTKDERLVGRLVQTIDTLEVYRHIASRDLKKVRSAGKSAQKLLELSERARSSSKDIEELENLLKMQKGNIGSNIEGGVYFRISNTLYYYDNLRSFMSTLKFHEVSGHDTYEAFIKRTLFKKLDYVELARQRIDKVNDVLNQVTSQSTAQKLSKNTEALKLSAHNQEMISKNQVNLTKFAHLIEIFAVTYYLGTILDYFFSYGNKESKAVIFASVFLFWWFFRDYPRKVKELFKNSGSVKSDILSIVVTTVCVFSVLLALSRV